jgi:signal transduction histidine kinase/uncharacterized protein YdeI (BOF family)
MRADLGIWLPSCPGWCTALFAGSLATSSLATARQVTDFVAAPQVTNLAQLSSIASDSPTQSHTIHLEGNVWWTRPRQDRFVLCDASGVAELEMDFHGQTIGPRQRVKIDGEGPVSKVNARIRLGTPGAVVQNDGTHSMVEKSGAVFLEAGWQPIRLEWFNGAEKSGLEVEYEGPDLPRQRIPDSAFRHEQPEGQNPTGDLLAGLEFRCYEGNWEQLPDFDALIPVKIGTTGNFDLGAVSRAEQVGLRFTGFLQVARRGLYIFRTRSDDGSRLFVGRPTFSVSIEGPGEIPQPRRLIIGQVMREIGAGAWVEVQGKVISAQKHAEGLDLEIVSGTASLKVEVADATGLPPSGLLNRTIRASGFCKSGYAAEGPAIPSVMLVTGASDLRESKEPSAEEMVHTNNATLPLLTSAAEVHGLTREEAQRGYRARIAGVVTCLLPEHQAFTVQDLTSGLYVVDSSSSRSVVPELGEFLQIEGVTDPGLFAPFVNAHKVRSLGAGHFPEPAKPTWDQLINGSLDAQYCEIEGMVLATSTNTATLRTHGGVLLAELRLRNGDTESLGLLQDAIVRIRGCLFASWDYVTHHVKPGEVRIYCADIVVKKPTPADLFDCPRKSCEDLLLFDPRASEFQRVAVSGQIIHSRHPEYFMMDSTRGTRFTAQRSANLEPGTFVEVVGFPDLSGVSPKLTDALVRTRGSGPLPQPRKIEGVNLLRAENDATLVSVDGQLVNIQSKHGEHVLELQSGVRSFFARLKADGNTPVPAWPVGSLLELTGAYAAEGGSGRLATRDVASFELLLNSPGHVRILSAPPWWTLKKLLFIITGLGCVLALAVLWLTQLHREVELRTVQLETQIQERQRAEQQHALEHERARVAQDLHDELGSGLTEITMLAARASAPTTGSEKRLAYLDQAGNKARELVSALDEIVWAMNPRHDSVASLVSYLCLYAERFLGLAGINWHLEGSANLPDQNLDGHYRHHLFLAFKEALTNVVRHSKASNVCLMLQFNQGEINLTIADDGKGISLDLLGADMEGIAGMRNRIQALGGRLEIDGLPGRGTKVCFCIPFS